MNRVQMELGFDPTAAFTPSRRRRRLTRARWWFDRMRAVVDCARDWAPAGPPRAEQIDLGLPGRRW
ncbi:MAG: hypothetical protein KGS61_00260 [Verrucomicrobia bacterium]|nr:hypothetical protein [Verrucomicrobiota bacterium]